MFEANNPYLAAGLFLRPGRSGLHGRPLPVSPRPLRRDFGPSLKPSPSRTKLLGIHPAVLLPFFFAVLAAVNLAALAASRFLFPPPASAEMPQAPAVPQIPGLPEGPEIPAPVKDSFLFKPEEFSSAFLGEPEIKNDLVMDFYRNPETREWVTGFFEQVCGSYKIAQVILEEAERYSISPSLAFALSWEESRFNYRAVNRKNRDSSIDRGLFQLNNRSFPKLGEAEFFDPRLNAFYGMAHLRICLDMGGSEIIALAMYNAGTGRVYSNGTPRQTLDYAARILSSRRKIDKAFLEEWTRQNPREEAAALPEEPAEAAVKAGEAVPAPEAEGFPPPFPLSPLSRRGSGAP